MSLEKITLQKEPSWYGKDEVGERQNVYAFIHEELEGKVILYFIHDWRDSLSGSFPYGIAEIDDSKEMDLPKIIDSIEYRDLESAQLALKRNYFYLLPENRENIYRNSRPSGRVLIDIRKHESGIFSKQDKYWIK